MNDKKLTILIIEDEQIYRSLALQVFENCDKIIASSAAEGLAKFKEFCPDITLLDIGLPDKNGLDLLPELISYDPEAFVVMLTLSRVASDVKSARTLGASGYIIKPFTFQKVSETIFNYREYRRKIQNMTPSERAGKLIETLKIEALHADLNRQTEEVILQKTEPKPENEVDVLLKNWRLIFADNYLINRERAGVQLSKLGCHVELAENSAQVLDKTSKEHYNILLIDSKIEPINGYDIAKEIRRLELEQNREKALLIVMVEDSDELDRHMWQKAGMNDFIKKPASFTRIREIIHKHAKQEIEKVYTKYIN